MLFAWLILLPTVHDQNSLRLVREIHLRTSFARRTMEPGTPPTKWGAFPFLVYLKQLTKLVKKIERLQGRKSGADLSKEASKIRWQRRLRRCF
jgi:hypothetical protein